MLVSFSFGRNTSTFFTRSTNVVFNRQFANAVGEIVAELFPRTWGLFKEGLK